MNATRSHLTPTEQTAEMILRELIDTLRAEIREFAELGDTFACDERHDRIASIESTLSTLNGERGDE